MNSSRDDRMDFVAQVVNLPYRRLTTGIGTAHTEHSRTFTASADCQSALRQATRLRYLGAARSLDLS